MQNFEATIISQYQASPVLTALIADLNQAVDPALNIDAFYEDIWNIATATGYGLDVWGRIVGIGRVITVPGGKNFGFEQAGTTSADPFDQSPFYNGVPATLNYALSDDAFRVLILVKALSNISLCSIPIYNKILMKLFPGRGNAYVTDTGNMTQRLNFEFTLQPFELAILKQSGAFSAPTGVGFVIMQVAIPGTFGFAQAGYSAAPFNQGTFFSGFS
jgi:hypothetical protein